MRSIASFFRRHKILTTFLILIILLALWVFSLRRSPHHSYELDFMIPVGGVPTQEPGAIEVGVAKREITIDFDTHDTWIDGNENSEYDIWTDALKPWQKVLFATLNKKLKLYDAEKAAQSGDSYVDKNGNGRFDPVWLAGFNVNRPAKGVHDPQWTRAMALRNNGVTVVMVTIDAIGIFHNDFITIRKAINPALNIDHIIFSSTHSHEVPDTMAIWSGPVPVLNYDDSYMKSIQSKTIEAIDEAVAALRPADMYCATTTLLPREDFVHDSRKPQVLDDSLYLWRFTRPGSDATIATLVNWGNHPEALGGSNGYLTSDFPHWLRLGLEEGVPEPNGVEGFGGMCLFFQGKLGGLANPLHVNVPKRDGSGVIDKNSFEKAEHLGYNVAIEAANALRGPDAWLNENPVLAVTAKTIYAPMEGAFKWGIMFGLIHQGYYWGGYSKTEVNALRVGNVMVTTVPGELYPEIAMGGIEAKPGRDFEISPVEVPPLQNEKLKFARQAFTLGLANDEIGYIIPKTQWDTEKPYVYEKSQYGEQNSGGSDVGPVIHAGMMEMIQRVNASFDAYPSPEPQEQPQEALQPATDAEEAESTALSAEVPVPDAVSEEIPEAAPEVEEPSADE
ncbi:MAG: hypothetical protein WCX86_00710 [Candidatus Hydrogenedentales bacterium]|jgi:hypothetical protein